jgi:Tol biopolymer transport system component
MYFQTLQGGAASPITPEGVVGTILSPDGRYLAAPSSARGYSLYPIHGGAPRPVSGTEPLDLIVGWSADGNSLFLRKRGELPIRIYRLNIATGKRDLLRQTSPPDSAGVEDVVQMKVNSDGRSYAYSCFTVLSDLYAVDDLR